VDKVPSFDVGDAARHSSSPLAAMQPQSHCSNSVPRLACALAVFLTLAGCSTTGGTVGGLFPAPKFLKGTIENDTYRSPDGLFQVGCPQPKDSYEYKYMAVKELYGAKGDYVSFGPAAYDISIYRVNVTGRTDDRGVAVSFEQVAELGVQAFSATLEKTYGVPFVSQAHEKSVVNGLPALTWTFTQTLPGQRARGAAEVLTHEVAAVDAGNNTALLWVQTPSSCYHCEGKAKAFINSFHMAR
jgi:hypothetical protein